MPGTGAASRAVSQRAGRVRSAQARGVKLALPAAAAAHGLHALLDGFIQNWLLEPGAFDLEAHALKAVDAYLRGIGLE